MCEIWISHFKNVSTMSTATFSRIIVMDKYMDHLSSNSVELIFPAGTYLIQGTELIDGMAVNINRI